MSGRLLTAQVAVGKLTERHRICFASAAGSRVDEKNGILSGVSIITTGPAKGHGLLVDATTLRQVQSCCLAFADGLQVKLEHNTDAGSIIGRLKNFHIAGEKLLGDLHLLRSHPRYASLIEMASDMPSSFGLSISFSGVSEELNGQKFVRCTELYSCDIVSHPACNPDGLFSVGSRPMTAVEWAATLGGIKDPITRARLFKANKAHIKASILDRNHKPVTPPGPGASLGQQLSSLPPAAASIFYKANKQGLLEEARQLKITHQMKAKLK